MNGRTAYKPMEKAKDKITRPPEYFMKAALKQAEKAFEEGEIPVGAVIVREGRIIASARNTKERTVNALAHAEMNCILKAQKKIKDWRLSDCEIYVTMEPCPMCTGAILNARLKKVWFGTPDYKAGCCGTLYNLACDSRFLWQTEICGGILREQCLRLIQDFFKEVRNRPKKSGDGVKTDN